MRHQRIDAADLRQTDRGAPWRFAVENLHISLCRDHVCVLRLPSETQYLLSLAREKIRDEFKQV
jgi:hypothetical protein